MLRDKIDRILRHGHAGDSVTACGWVRSKRDSKEWSFLALSDGSCQGTLQVVAAHDARTLEALKDISTGACVRARGVLKESAGREQDLELAASELTVLGTSPAAYPLQKKGHTLEFLRDIAHLRPRTNTFGAVMRVRNVVARAVHEFFQSRGFCWIHTPIITASDCEGAGELFQVTTLNLEGPLPRTGSGDHAPIDYGADFFGRKAHLTVSGQLQAEFLALSLGDVYTFGPTFRAENSNTTRHLAEFWMIEPEMAFADLQDDMVLAEDFFRHICRVVLRSCEEELAFFAKHYEGQTSPEMVHRLADSAFARMRYSDAIRELEKANAKFEFAPEWGKDLQSEHERYLADVVFGGPVIVFDYPRQIKPFYMRVNGDGKTVAAMDVLVPKIGEIIGGSQREERLSVLEDRMRETKVNSDDLTWFLDLRRYGTCPHAGFGMGFERVVQYLTGMGNIRDVIPCPRAPRTISF